MPYLFFFILFILFGGVASAQEAPHVEGNFGDGHHKYHNAYEQLLVEVNELKPGDKGFGAPDYGPLYQQLYSAGKCHCKSGYCRPTEVRRTQNGIAYDYDVKINGEWYPVPLDSLKNENNLSKELMGKLMGNGATAHVCAYDDPRAPRGQRIECTIFYLGG